MFGKPKNNSELKTQVLTIESVTNGYWLRQTNNVYTQNGTLVTISQILVAKNKQELLKLVKDILVDVNGPSNDKQICIGFNKGVDT